MTTIQLPIDPSAEAVLVAIQTQNRNFSLMICFLYRPPSASSEELAVTRVTDGPCHSQRDVVWLGGDMDLPAVHWITSPTTGNQYPKAMNRAYINKHQDAGNVHHNSTRGDTILSNRPSLLSRCGAIPGPTFYVVEVVLTKLTLGVLHVVELYTSG